MVEESDDNKSEGKEVVEEEDSKKWKIINIEWKHFFTWKKNQNNFNQKNLSTETNHKYEQINDILNP